ncbi:MAG: amino acid ABC transporter ATP-binding protein [Chthoniobacterales bacterium]|nr:amino acid ABC transporter ATP-binding protein [Chthoniobacterales bacterium]
MKVTVSNLDKSFAIDGCQKELFKDLTFSVTFDHVLAVIGYSGSGKTTLLRLLAGLEIPEGGHITIDDELLHFEPTWLRHYQKRLGFVFQQHNLFPHYSALENVMLPLRLVCREEVALAKEKAITLMKRLNIFQHAAKKPHQLSGGAAQRVAIARALVTQPRFLLLDEPTASLDVEMKVEVLDLISELKETQTPVLLVTHEIGFAHKCADHILFFEEGTVLEQGPAAQFFEHPKEERVKKFLSKAFAY